MTACERCWSDANGVPHEYHRLLDARQHNPCTAEEQAGPRAGKCPACHRMTLHQYTGRPMCGCSPDNETEGNGNG